MWYIQINVMVIQIEFIDKPQTEHVPFNCVFSCGQGWATGFPPRGCSLTRLCPPVFTGYNATPWITFPSSGLQEKRSVLPPGHMDSGFHTAVWPCSLALKLTFDWQVGNLSLTLATIANMMEQAIGGQLVRLNSLIINVLSTGPRVHSGSNGHRPILLCSN